MKTEELKQILREHEEWVESFGSRGKYANLRSADLHGSILCCANLRSADLRGANLRSADLRGTHLEGANLEGADLHSADLYCAYLDGANLKGAKLEGANLNDAVLSNKELIRKGIIVKRKMTGWKKCQNGIIVKLEIPANAIVFSINNNKFRTNIAKVVNIIGGNGKTAVSNYDSKFVYRKGRTIKVTDFNLMYNVECGKGIHFFRTRKEAEKYLI